MRQIHQNRFVLAHSIGKFTILSLCAAICNILMRTERNQIDSHDFV